LDVWFPPGFQLSTPRGVQFVPQFPHYVPYSFKFGSIVLNNQHYETTKPIFEMNKRSLNILCIDDDWQIREFLNVCFKHLHHRVMLASGGRHGLELFRTATLKNEPYEVVITDLGMPDMDGNGVARAIKAESPHTPVILMTGYGASASNEDGFALEADAVIGKPPHIKELNDLLLQITAPAPGRESELAA
jgi:CheY-like chemotaxis protein